MKHTELAGLHFLRLPCITQQGFKNFPPALATALTINQFPMFLLCPPGFIVLYMFILLVN